MTTHADPSFADGAVPAAFQPQPPVPLPVYEQQLPQLADPQAAMPPSVQIPEGGYARRVTTVPLPQLRLEGVPEPWIEMRNPGLMAADTIDEISNGLNGIRTGPDGEPEERDRELMMATMRRLLRRWCMWDGTSEDDIPPQLPDIPTPELLSKAPIGALKAIGSAFKELQNPQ